MFEPLGYYKEYYVNSKFVGKLNCEKDREIIGYYGKIFETLVKTITTDNGRKIKAGTEVYTLLYPLGGKLQKNG